MLNHRLQHLKNRRSSLSSECREYPVSPPLPGILLLQKKIVRIISKASFDAHTGPLFKDLQILKFHNIYQYHTGKLVFLFTRNLLPNYFQSIFMLTSQVHSYNSRTSKLFYIFPCRTNLRQFSIRFQGPKFFLIR